MSTVLLIVVLISSVAYILGGMLVLIKKKWSQHSVLAMTAMSAGLLLSISILDLIPDTQEQLSNNSLYIMLGLVIMYLVSYLTSVSKKKKSNIHGFDESSMMGISLGMSLHNVFEGVSIGVSYAISVNLGLVVSLALIFHKIPEGITYASSVFAITQNRRKTAINLFIQGLFIWLGVGLAILLSYFTEINEKFMAIPIAMTAGIFIYLGGTSLLPVANKITNRTIPISFVCGVIFFLIFRSISELLG
ncbi:ZIP family metal transporter [Neobacillus cucumis]|uniref:ZIP family metal transporter n=1 Tax=Neobacillus cucumis TaxID=1740721 RepID=UPI0019661095|nr:ZIP family metal transporter [Neobacillus cucumis]MBM7651159.1 zinc transporter ZupT [Neobacillus cucumis]